MVLLVAGVAAFVRLPYDILAPGTAQRVNDLVVVRGSPRPRGAVLYPTVSLREGANIYEVLAGWLDPNVDVEHEKDIRGSIPRSQFERFNQELMSESKQAAEVVVLRKLGFPVAGGALIAGVERDFPAASTLQDRDVVTVADGKPVVIADDLVAAVRAHSPGDRLKLRLVRGEEAPRDVEVALAGRPGHTMLGVQVTTKVKLPFDIAIDSGDVGGPSAGLAYAVYLYDLLTPGELTGGKVVAATGELGFDGKVSPIGGATQKTTKIRSSGASLFLVPRQNLAEARAHRGKHLQVVGVDTFDQALQVLIDRNRPGAARG